jgi:hypothetical protein
MDVNRGYLRNTALTFRSSISFEVCARLCSSPHLLRLSDKDRRNLGGRFGIAGDTTTVDMGTGIVPVIVNSLNWKVTYQMSLMGRLVAFEFSYDEVVANDFD